jgi:hypothetical protein
MKKQLIGSPIFCDFGFSGPACTRVKSQVQILYRPPAFAVALPVSPFD